MAVRRGLDTNESEIKQRKDQLGQVADRCSSGTTEIH
jgi:hypothetical protein